MEISKNLEKVYVLEEEVREQYLQISEINNCITKDLLNARIFFKPKYLQKTIPSIEKPERNVLVINLSAMYWTNYDGASRSIVEKIRNDYIRVCYATHNSLEEIKDFLTYLKPKKVNLNVIPTNVKEKFEMFKQLREIQKMYMTMRDDEDEEQPVNVKKRYSFKRIGSKTFTNKETASGSSLKKQKTM